MGLVQPASAALYDYYNPGEHCGDTREVWGRFPMWVIGNWDRRGWQGSLVAPQGRRQRGGICPNSPLLFSRAQVFCVLWSTN